jgi:carboxy-cis,cis-muconate cyclase
MKWQSSIEIRERVVLLLPILHSLQFLLVSGLSMSPDKDSTNLELLILSNLIGYTNTSLYWSDEVMFSVPKEGDYPKYLFATARSRTSTDPGFVTAFSLDSTTGAIKERLFLTPTTGSGGAANAISPATFSEQYFAITDAENNFIEVWKLDDNETSVSVVAHLDTEDSPANLVWVD